MFYVFVPLIVRTAVSEPIAVPVGAFSAFLLLPITNLSTYPSAHPFTQTILYSTLVVFVALRFVFDRSSKTMSSYGVLLGIACVVLVLGHPLQALNLILLFAGISIVQFLYRTNNGIAGYRSLSLHTVFLTVVFLLWTMGKDTFQQASTSYPRALLPFISGTSPAGSDVASQSSSLVALGGSPEELALKILGAGLVYGGLSGLLVMSNVFGRLRSQFAGRDRYLNYTFLGVLVVSPLVIVLSVRPVYITQISLLVSDLTAVALVLSALVTGFGLAVLGALALMARGSSTAASAPVDTNNASVTYMTVGIAFVAPLFVLFFAGSIAELYWRILGFLLLLFTILGSIALVRLGDTLDSVTVPRTAKTVFVVFFAILLPLSVLEGGRVVLVRDVVRIRVHDARELFGGAKKPARSGHAVRHDRTSGSE
jgi:hypothetical protein